MSDLMRLASMKSLLIRMFEEYKTQNSIFDLPKKQWYRKADYRKIGLLGESCGTVLGPAAGPHTQLAQNIVAAYLTGSRFIELKTVQILDKLELEKPCIDATDEGYNTEWSTELALEEAWREYTRAWIALHIIEGLFEMKPADEPRSFIFNMSIGYDLTGILSETMQRFIAWMKDCSTEALFKKWLEESEKELPILLKNTDLEAKIPEIPGIIRGISGKICKSVTLSTMHGCPPNEIESICNYTLSKQKLHTYVKLNPTLLGLETVRHMLSGLGYDYVELDKNGFDHDLQYHDAIRILETLRLVAREQKLIFGVKLTNTLACRNNMGELPGEEMYLSGRALFPLTVNLASRLSEHFKGDLPISFSGGITIHNVEDVFQTGIRPITMATDLLKPGGYLRQKQMADKLDAIDNWNHTSIDVEALKKLALRALDADYLNKDFRGEDEVTIPGYLPLFDCYEAPCITACAIGQHIPEYIRLAGEGRFSEALSCIYERNALPSITGHICDRQCELACTRLDYEGALNIREIKKIAVKTGMEEFRKNWIKPEVTRTAKVAVLGAGPAGLSAAYFLVREGFPVSLFEREADAGGVVRYTIPHFRVSRETIESDVDFIKDNGVDFHFNARDMTVEKLKSMGFTYIVMGVGTYRSKQLPLKGGNSNVHPALQFLRQFNDDPTKLNMGKHVVVIGAGDTAMDCARSALRCQGTEKSTVVYRRAFKQMPASRDEYRHALADRVAFHWLRNPESFSSNGTLTLRVMELGEKDATGRRRPVPTDKTETLKVDSIVYAIGDEADPDVLRSLGLNPNTSGNVDTGNGGETDQQNVFLIGDARTGTSTIVKCIQEGRLAADAICRKDNPNWSRKEELPPVNNSEQLVQITDKNGKIVNKPDTESYTLPAFNLTELNRCLECNYVCNKCVDVCPNRANIAVPVQGEPLFSNPNQIVHIDAYCNECGDCGHFCPWEGRPYIDKPTVFSSLTDFESSENPGWLEEGNDLHVRFNGKVLVNPQSGTSTDKIQKDLKFDSFMRLYDILKETRPELFATMDTERNAQ